MDTLPTLIAQNLILVVVGVCGIFLLAAILTAAFRPARHEDISNCQSWDKFGRPVISRRKVSR